MAVLGAAMTGFWDGRGVFLTGGTGFIGGQLARRMLKQGADVTVMTRDASRASDLAEVGCDVHEGDITDPDTIDVGDADTVIHGAAWVAYGIPKRKRELFYETNVDGTKHVLAAAKDAGVERFSHLSSVAAIGPTPAGLYPEERAVDGRYPEYESLYAETKHKAHLHVLEEHGSMRTTLPMPSVVIGLGSDFEGILRSYANGMRFSLKGDTPTGFVHVQDTVDGILAAVEHGEGPYILNEYNLLFDELLDRFEQASGIPKPDRQLPLWLLKGAARVLEVPYHLRGKVPPLSSEILRSLGTPKTYAADRAVEDLGWEPDLDAHLEDDFAQLTGEG